MYFRVLFLQVMDILSRDERDSRFSGDFQETFALRDGFGNTGVMADFYEKIASSKNFIIFQRNFLCALIVPAVDKLARNLSAEAGGKSDEAFVVFA